MAFREDQIVFFRPHSFRVCSRCRLPSARGSQRSRLQSPVDLMTLLHRTLDNTEAGRIKGFTLGFRESKMLPLLNTNNRICWAWAMTFKNVKLSFS